METQERAVRVTDCPELGLEITGKRLLIFFPTPSAHSQKGKSGRLGTVVPWWVRDTDTLRPTDPNGIDSSLLQKTLPQQVKFPHSL